MSNQYVWLITGVAGFIGSNLLEFLIGHDQKVLGVDNLCTGKLENIEAVRRLFPDRLDNLFVFFQGDIREKKLCKMLCSEVDFILHHAAISSVQYSIRNPIETFDVNAIGTLNLMLASNNSRMKRFVYASSSAVYGNQGDGAIDLIHPYASTKYINELCFRFLPEAVGLRYFNVFGNRQDPSSPDAAVIPKWIELLRIGRRPVIYGNGTATRDFCHVDNIVQANVLACLQNTRFETGTVLNVASGNFVSLNELFLLIRKYVAEKLPSAALIEAEYEESRIGDILHSSANIEKIQTILGYAPAVSLDEGVKKLLEFSI